MSESISRYLQIDEEGFLISDGLRITDEDYGLEVLSQIRIDERLRTIVHIDNSVALVEYFDAPFVAQQIHCENDTWTALLPYGFRSAFRLDSLCLDEWDRFHGTTDQKIPFVMSRPAQAHFFGLLDDYDDDSITHGGQRYVMPPWLLTDRKVDQELFWSQIYRTETPGWELGGESAILSHILPQLKIPRCRVIVLGCGSGHDAAFFARQGHLVTGVDMSPEAIERAQKLYGQVPGLRFLQSDVFALDSSLNHSFDIVFEHTCYCAVSPDRRNDLRGVWRRLLVDGGHLLGVFFVMPKRLGPPWGGSEWEIRQRLRQHFSLRYWTRWRHSIEKRQGLELVVYAQKLEAIQG